MCINYGKSIDSGSPGWKHSLSESFIAGKPHLHYGLAFLFIFTLGMIFAPLKAAAQSGTVIGEVLDASTGETLPGATVIIEGTNLGTATDIDGRYTLRRVPVGDHVLVFSYMGYESQEIPINVSEDERVELNVTLQDILIMGDDVLITARQRGQARALTRQRESVNIRNVVSSEQIDAFADQTVTGALQRIVGMGHGGTSIRGLGAGSANITMDGQRMGTTGDNRSVDLSTISVDMVQELDVIKVITPDMYADAMSGVINISTRRPIGGDRNMNIRLGGGFQDRYLRHAGSESRASISYGESPNDRFTYGINLSYQRDPNSQESISMNWADKTFRNDEGDQVVNVLSDLQNQLQFDIRERYAAGFQMTFQPTDRSTYHVQSMFNYQDRTTDNHQTRYAIVVDNYVTPNITGDRSIGSVSSSQNRLSYNPRRDESITNQYTVQLGGRHLMDWYDMEYILGWGHGRFHEDSYRHQVRTITSNFEFNLDMDDRTRPIIDVNQHGSRKTYDAVVNDFQWDFFDYYISRHRDNEFTGKLDFEVPYNMGKIKYGVSSIMSFRQGDGERFGGGSTNYERQLKRDELDLLPNATWQMFDRDHTTYRIPWMIDLEKSRDLYWGHRPHFSFEQSIWAEEMETSTYIANEYVYGVYGMGDVTFNKLTFLGGLRVEHSINLYKGRESMLSGTSSFLGARDVRSLNSYTYLFPNAQAVYSLADMTKVRAAYSRSIGRPSFSQLSPRLDINYDNEIIRGGNPLLRPMISDNLDFIIEHYFMNVGQLSAGLFYKQMTDFVFSRTFRLSEDDAIALAQSRSQGASLSEDELLEFVGWEMRTSANGDEATAYGIELSWQQNLSFLPGFLGNLGTFTNYAYTNSAADIGRRDPEKLSQGIVDTILVRMSGQRPHVVNAGLSYIQGAFNGQITYHWSAPNVSSRGELQYVPEIHQRHREYFDQYRDAANDLSLTVRYRLTSNFRIWADASNILNNRRIDYYVDRDVYPRTIALSGRRISVGLRYTL